MVSGSLAGLVPHRTSLLSHWSSSIPISTCGSLHRVHSNVLSSGCPLEGIIQKQLLQKSPECEICQEQNADNNVISSLTFCVFVFKYYVESWEIPSNNIELGKISI